MTRKVRSFTLKDSAACATYLGHGDICVGYMTVSNLEAVENGIWVTAKPNDGPSYILCPWSSIAQATYYEPAVKEKPVVTVEDVVVKVSGSKEKTTSKAPTSAKKRPGRPRKKQPVA